MVSDDERRAPTTRASRPKSAQRLALRARIILAWVDEPSDNAVAARLGVCGATVGTWRSRFVARRPEGLADDPRPGTPRKEADADVERVVTRTPETKPANATHRSPRGMAKAAGMSQSAVGRIWRAFGLEPHRADTVKLSADPFFAEKVRDVVGLSLSPPDRAVVLCVDETSGTQALDRTRPVLPMTPGQAGRGTHDSVRHGTTSLFAALDVATGRVIGTCRRRHRQQEVVKSLDHLHASLPREPGGTVHVVLGNSAAHKTPAVKRWLLRHPGGHLHFTPTSGSWRNRVERFFAAITEKRLRRGVFRSVEALEQAIEDYLAGHNADPKPFAWVADADAILDRVKRVCERTSDSGD